MTTGIAVRAVRRASATVPIVVAATRDAVAAGFTSSLAKPADNITGQSFLNTELSAKRLALLRDTVPRADAADVLASAWLNAHRERLVELAAQSARPAIYERRDFVDAGGLMSYGQNLT